MTESRKFDFHIGTLKLSEAIRIGAKLRPQAKKLYCHNGGTCAIGAAAHGMYPHLADVRQIEVAAWKVANKLAVDYGRKLTDEIYYRNDNGQTREQIADWLEAQGL
jgi:uncharacterized NAD(P)/FAD-binding protein YdhS